MSPISSRSTTADGAPWSPAPRLWRTLALAVLAACLLAPVGGQAHQTSARQDPLSVHQRRVQPLDPLEDIDWAGRIDALLATEPGIS
jgi:hypothetical protein